MNILFVGGGTLGSVTPLIAVKEAIVELDKKTSFYWIGTKEGPEREVVEKSGITFLTSPTAKLRRYFDLRNVTDFFKFLFAFFRALKLLKKIKPNVVVSAGGFVAVPVIFAAFIRRIPVHVHQLDLVPGLANRLAFPFAESISVSFPELVQICSRGKVQAEMTGTPLRTAVFAGNSDKARKKFGISANRKVVVVLGGGTGAEGLNKIIYSSLQEILEIADVIHVTGKGKNNDKKMSGYHQIEFLFDDLLDCFALADTIVTRAGIGTLTEVAALGKPMLIIPLPGSQQVENAKYFDKLGAGIYVDQTGLKTESFMKILKKLLTDSELREHMSSCGPLMVPHDARESVAHAIIKIAQH